MTSSVSLLPAGFAFSQTSLQDYADCPRRFQLRYLDKLAYPAVEAEPALETERRTLEGQAFHRLAQQYLLGISPARLTPLARSPDLARWWEHFTASAEIARLKALPARYLEFILSASLGEVRLTAKYDLIAVTDDERLLIYDWKTYRKRPRNEWLAIRWQTRVYRALLTAAGTSLNAGRPIVPERCEMIYWFADFPDDPARFPYNSSQFQRDWDALTRLTEEIRSASSYPLTDDRRKCVYCPYRSYCARGAQAGNLDSTEMEMEAEAETLFDVDFEQIGEIAF